MKGKKNLYIFGGIGLVVVVFAFYFLFTHQDKNTSFTIFEKQWLENNKNRVLDISILQDVPIINYNGSGLLFDFLEDFENVTGLEFNKIAYKTGGDIKSDYSFQVVSQKSDNDLLFYSDNYVLLTKSMVKYNKLSEISDLKVGILNSDLDRISNVMGNTVVLKGFDDIDSLISAVDVSNVKDDGSIDESIEVLDGIIIPKMSNLNLILSNSNLNISYNINEIREDYVLHLGSDDKLNDIITKYFNKWSDTKYSDSFNKYFSSSYFSFHSIDDKEKAKFKSKRYSYGYVENRPYDSKLNDDLYGINKAFLDGFSSVSDVEIDYKFFDSKQDMVDAFNSFSIDFLFDNLSGYNFTSDSVNLISNYDEDFVCLSLPSNKVTVSSIKSLASYNVVTLENTMIYDYLVSNGIDVKGYKDVKDIIDHVKDDSIIVLDSEIFDYYSLKVLSKYKSVYTFNMENEYSFRVLNNDDNKVFIDYFNFYLSFISNQEVSNVGYSNLVDLTSTGNAKFVVIGGISLVVLGLFGILFIQNKRNAGEKLNISKDSKIKYIDVLTSLKNRNYLNDNIDIWDESMIYPQGIVVIDLNNIAYVNDNYGHSEGDKVIKEAANILIKTQVSNTEIIRTNGNEFLVYMVGYDEKQIVSYIRKLNKEFRELSHNFGAAIGYSIITDEIKTIDDAINEATIDMKNNKEESR